MPIYGEEEIAGLIRTDGEGEKVYCRKCYLEEFKQYRKGDEVIRRTNRESGLATCILCKEEF